MRRLGGGGSKPRASLERGQANRREGKRKLGQEKKVQQALPYMDEMSQILRKL